MAQDTTSWIDRASNSLTGILGQIFNYNLERERISQGSSVQTSSVGNPPHVNTQFDKDFKLVIYGIFGMVALTLIIFLFKSFSSKKR